jgi:hypothetical protein
VQLIGDNRPSCGLQNIHKNPQCRVFAPKPLVAVTVWPERREAEGLFSAPPRMFPISKWAFSSAYIGEQSEMAFRGTF